MKFFIVLSAVAALAVAYPGYHQPQVTYSDHHSYHGPPAPLAHDGQVIDTPEVAHAKAAHFAAYAEAASHAHYGAPHGAPHGDYEHETPSYGTASYEHAAPVAHAYHGPLAPLGHDGRVIDTPEVAHARAAHLSAHAEEYAKVSSHSVGHSGYYGASPNHQW